MDHVRFTAPSLTHGRIMRAGDEALTLPEVTNELWEQGIIQIIASDVTVIETDIRDEAEYEIV